MSANYDNQLRLLPLFAQLPPQHLAWVREAVQVMRYEPGESVFQQGDPAQGMIFFLSGQGQLIRAEQDGRRRILATINANQYLNEAALFREGVETATLFATQTATILFVSRAQLQQVVTYHPEIKPYLPIPVETVRAQALNRAFRGQRDNEKVLLTTRRHWWVFASKAWMPGLLMVGLLILAALAPFAFLSFLLGVLGFIIPGAMMVYFYLEWQNDHIIITDQRVIHIERVIHNLKEHRSEIPLTSIQQINADLVTADIFSRIFNYGTVDIRTAGDAGNVKLTYMRDPDGIQDLIFANRTQIVLEQERQHKNTIRAEVDRVLQGKDAQASSAKGVAQVAVPPRGIFPTKFIDSKGDTVYRKHMVYYIGRVFPAALLLIGAIVFLFFFAGRLGPLGFLLDLLFVIGAGAWYWWADWDWRHDIYKVGDEMIQIIHKRPLFLQNEDDQVLLDRVDNVTASRRGILQSLFNYGTVEIALVGGDRGDQKRFEAVPRPAEVQEEITRRQQRWRNRHATELERRRREEIAEYLGVYHETLQQRGQIAPDTPAQNTAPSAPSDADSPPQGRGMRPPNIPRRRG